MSHELQGDLVVTALWSLIWFGLGVTWAAYRAVSWVDRMKTWAATVAVTDNETE